MGEITAKKIESIIYVIRGQKVMLDSDLAELYGVETKYLNRQVARNKMRFPDDFAFNLNQKEWESLRCQFVTSKKGKGGRRYTPLVFTENGVAMLSGVLNSETAILVNVSIMRMFTKMRQILNSNETLTERIEKLERGTDKFFRIVFERLDQIESTIPDRPVDRKKTGIKNSD